MVRWHGKGHTPPYPSWSSTTEACASGQSCRRLQGHCPRTVQPPHTCQGQLCTFAAAITAHLRLQLPLATALVIAAAVTAHLRLMSLQSALACAHAHDMRLGACILAWAALLPCPLQQNAQGQRRAKRTPKQMLQRYGLQFFQKSGHASGRHRLCSGTSRGCGAQAERDARHRQRRMRGKGG